MNTQENNKMIAEFMGNKTIRINVPFEYDLGEELPTSGNICNSVVDAMEEVQIEVDNGIISGYDLCMEALEYHTSWDWLMPVIERCLVGEAEQSEEISNTTIKNIYEGICNQDISFAYKSVVEFIKFQIKK